MPPKNEVFGISDLFPDKEETDNGYIGESTTDYNKRQEAAALAGVPAEGYVEITQKEIDDYAENGPVEDWEMDWILNGKAIQQAREKGAIAEKVLWQGQEHGGAHNTGVGADSHKKGTKFYGSTRQRVKQSAKEQRRIEDKQRIKEDLQDYETSLDEDFGYIAGYEAATPIKESTDYETELVQLLGPDGKLLTDLPKTDYLALKELQDHVEPVLQQMYSGMNTLNEFGKTDWDKFKERNQLKARIRRLEKGVTILTTTEPYDIPQLDETTIDELTQYIEEELANIDLMKNGGRKENVDRRSQDPNAVPRWMLSNDPSGRQHYRKPGKSR